MNIWAEAGKLCRSAREFIRRLAFHAQSHEQCAELRRGAVAGHYGVERGRGLIAGERLAVREQFQRGLQRRRRCGGHETVARWVLVFADRAVQALGKFRLARDQRDHQAEQTHALDVVFDEQPVLCAVREVDHADQFVVQHQRKADE